MAARYDEFRDLNSRVIGISTDSVFSHKIFAEISPSARQVQYPLLSDPAGSVSTCYGAYNPETGFASRTTVIISPQDRLIRYFSKYPGRVGRNVNELLRIIAALQFTERTGQGAPAGWQAGDPGLSPDWDLVGEI